MALELLGRKLGMTQIFNSDGDRVGVTVLEIGPCTVVQKKSEASDGYTALQIGFADKRVKNTTKPQQGHFAKAKTAPKRMLVEVPIDEKALEAYELGQVLPLEGYEVGQHIDVIGKSKGRGFAGVVKRHGFPTRGHAHGAHEVFRHGGAMSAGTFPGRIRKGLRMAGHMGDGRVTQLNVRVERVDSEKNLVYVRGAVPGHNNGYVRIRPTVK